MNKGLTFLIDNQKIIVRCIFLCSLVLNVIFMNMNNFHFHKYQNTYEKHDNRKFASSGYIYINGKKIEADKVVSEHYEFKRYNDVLKFRNSIMIHSLLLSDIIYNCNSNKYEVFVVSFLKKRIKDK